MHKPNKLLEHEVRGELDWDPALDASRIVVKVDRGVVRLAGVVKTYDDLFMALDDAWMIAGVTAVDNQLLVGPEGAAITDVDIATECMKSLNADRFVPEGAVTPGVFNGRVTLEGEVCHHRQRFAAERAVGRVHGVLGITNNIWVKK